ncbi:HopJ type III effector protein [Empedobacter brevis]|uniref:HopJ type III effector protein n=1 Tax=Empedobacter brevis TaxID=247 RepID=UPI002FE00732
MILEKVHQNKANFAAVIHYIEENYFYNPSSFINGDQENTIDQNQGSAKVFAFAKLNNFSKEDTLKLFAEHYQAVLATPEGTDHNNIRQFMQHGWEGVKFENEVLKKK